MKTCTRCYQDLPIKDFPHENGRPIARCQSCKNETWRLGDREKRQRENEHRKITRLNQIMSAWP